MSYVPATFTAGVALVLTAAGAVGGQWVSNLRESTLEPRTSSVERRESSTPPSAMTPALPVLRSTAAPALEVLPTLPAPAATKKPLPLKMSATKVDKIPAAAADKVNNVDKGMIDNTPAFLANKSATAPLGVVSSRHQRTD